MRFLSTGKIDLNIISIIVGSIFCFLSRLMFKIDTQFFNQKIFPNFLASFCRTFTLVPILISKCRLKNHQNDNSQNLTIINVVDLIYNDRIDNITKGTWKYIILTGILIFIQGILILYTYPIKTNCWIWDISITCFLYYLIFKIKLYKHHYLSMILIFLIGLFIDLLFGNLQNDIKNNILFLLLRFLREIIYSSTTVINKYIMEKKYCSVYDLSLYTGIIDVLLYGVFAVINYYYLKIDDFEKYFSNFNNTELLVSLGALVTQFGIHLSSLITNKNYTPCHIFIIFVFGQLAYYLDFSINSIILIICFIFILFFALVFNEIIEINFWGLSYNTKRNIAKRAEKEDEILNIDSSINSIDVNDETLVL